MALRKIPGICAEQNTNCLQFDKLGISTSIDKIHDSKEAKKRSVTSRY